MKEQIKIPERKNKPEHLKEGVKPIMACVGTEEQFKDYPGPTTILRLAKYYHMEDRGGHVDYFGSPVEHEKKGFKNEGKGSFVISSVDEQDKFSVLYVDCTGVVVAGEDKETGEKISFLSHEDPSYFLHGEEYRDKFIAALDECLEEIKRKCGEGTIDAKIFGGNFLPRREENPSFSEYTQERYLKSIELLSKELSKVLGFEPDVVTGPKNRGGGDDVFYDNENKRLYIVRPKIDTGTLEPYKPKNISEQSKKWQKKISPK